MKKMKLLLALTNAVSTISLLVSFSAEDRAIDPQGEQGISGLEGTAKVMYFNWLTASHSSRISSSKILQIDESHKLDWEKDVVFVYGKCTGIASAILLPYFNLDDHENIRFILG